MLEVRTYALDKIYGSSSGTLTPFLDQLGGSFDTIHNSIQSCNYLAFDGNGVDLLDNNLKFYEEGEFPGYTLGYSEKSNIPKISDENCYFGIGSGGYARCLRLNTVNTYDTYPKNLAIKFYGNCCSEIDIVYHDKLGLEFPETISITGELTNINLKSGYYVVEIYFTKTVLPYQAIRLENIVFGNVNSFTNFTQHSLLEEINILSDDLPINQLELTMVAENGELNLYKRDTVNVFNNTKYYGEYYVTNIERTAQNLYNVTAQNLIGNLSGEEYIEWVSTGPKLSKFISELNSKIVIDENTIDYTLFGYIPIETKRYALCAACFACGLMVDGSRSDKVHLKKIPTEISSVILTKDRRIIGEAIFKESEPISRATVTYPSDVDDSETGSVTLNSEGDGWHLHYFDNAPVIVYEHSGNTLYNSADNYVEYKSENDTVTFKYYKLKYSNSVESTHNPNLLSGGSKEYKEFQLRGGIIGDDNYVTRISRLKDIQKYISSKGTVTAKIRLRNEKVGDLIQIETAWDGIITGIITKMTISFSYEDIADIEVVEWSI